MEKLMTHISKKIDMMLFEFIHNEGGFTHAQLLESFLLFFMIVSIMAIVILGFPVFYAKLWAKIVDPNFLR
jgi:uncharacterized protein YqhQ